MSVTRTIEFLPAFFKTEQNRKFLSATLDQLVSEPNLVRLNGYVGRKNSVNYKQTDNYLLESSDSRANYQLEPSVIARAVDGAINFTSSYQDLLDKLEFLGVDTTDNSRLNKNEYYTYNGLVDFDKFVNFSQYYWLPNGPDAVTVFGTEAPVQATYTITPDGRDRGAFVTGAGGVINPTIVLARGGRYEFNSLSINNIWIQSEAGTSGFKSQQANISSREVVGVEDNGTNSVIFNVPQVNAQDQFLLMNKVADIDLASTRSYADIEGKTFNEFIAAYPDGIDGQRNLVGKLIVFLNPANFDDEIDWDAGAGAVDPALRYGIWRFPNITDPDAVITLAHIRDVATNEKVFVREGRNGGNREYYKNTNNRYQLIPVITVVQDVLFYQDGNDANIVGEIHLVDPLQIVNIDVDSDIVGKTEYTSPNGVVFTNGLKVQFDANVIPASYAGKSYYVEGVGTAIELVDQSLLITPESFTTNQSIGFDIGGFDSTNYDEVLNAPTESLYITIKRNSHDLNPWTRNNRWFHEEVIRATAAYNNFIPVLDQRSRASRPVIEFDADLALFNSGRVGKTSVDLYDTAQTDAFGFTSNINVETLTIEGKTSAIVDGVSLTPGMRVIFANDAESTVRDKIYVVNFIDQDGLQGTAPIIHLTLAEDGVVEANDNIVVTKGVTNQGKSFWYNGANWTLGQQLDAVNQEPVFDVFDGAGFSLADPVVYPGSTFAGTKVLSYRRGIGKPDNILGFAISYRNFASVGDIVFDNNYVTDTFAYSDAINSTKTQSIGIGSLAKIHEEQEFERVNIWTTIVEDSKQYQQFSFFYDTNPEFKVNITEAIVGNIPNTKVYVNNRILPVTKHSYVYRNGFTYLLINTDSLTTGDKVDVYIYSLQSSDQGFYQIPVNLDNNSVNLNFDSITLGQMRNHVQACFENSVDIAGVFPGSSNIRDIAIKDNPGKILQHSAPLTYAMTFMNNETASFERGVDLARREYTRFKNKFLELAFSKTDFDVNDPVEAVDHIMQDLNSFKTQDMPWFRSDMVPYGDDKQSVSYVITNTATRAYEINSVYVDYTPASRAVLVYLNGEQLIRGRDYTFDDAGPNLFLSDSLVRDFNDVLTIDDYNGTDGCWVPETPTKLGLYPQFTPEIVTDNSFRDTQTVIVGHDGSRTIAFGDFRDQLLLELEKRIYNNIKVRYDATRLDINSLRPGKFRDTDFSRTAFDELLATYFLRWTGANRVEYTTNTFYDNSDGFTWNYSSFVDKIDGEILPGAWRGIFRYFFDCEDPSQRPWEMLGFSERPDWWTVAYGPAPYTSGNLVLWEDLARGRILLGERAGIDPLYVRPGLLDIIPVNEYGDLQSPHEFIVQRYQVRNTVGSFVAGDVGPTEAAWTRSSEFPYAMQYALALSAPAKYFGLQVNTYNYVRDVQLNQYVFAPTNARLTQSDIKVHGEDYDGVVTRTTGYLNWIADYIRNLGLDAKDVLTRTVNDFTVQLAYKLAGYSDKKLLKALAEQASPTSTNESIIIPDEDYSIVLNKSVPIKRLTYSAVLITKTNGGWSVEGYDLENPVFTIVDSDVTGQKKTVVEGGATVVVYQKGRPQTREIPYGTEFTSRQQVTDFLTSYERYLESQGFLFNAVNKELGQIQNWTLSVREFLTWSQQGWNPGNILVLTPFANELSVSNELFIIDTLNDAKTSGRILDLNFRMLKPQDFRVFRDTNLTSVTIENQSVGLAKLTAIQYEHIIVFNNTTVFNDVIYQPELGNRQSRIKIVGQKTGSWDGSLTAPGYVINQGVVPNWQAGIDYKKADIVIYKGQYYTASKDLIAADVFDYNSWIISDYGDIARGLLPNFANRAGAIENYYGVDDVNLENDTDALSKGLIGFRSRGYLTDIGLDDSSQVKFYQGYIKEKGTRRSLESLTRAQIDRLNSDIRFFEDWAVRVGEYGATSSTQAVEVTLNESQFSANPSFFTFLDDSENRPLNRLGLKLADLYKRPQNFQSDLFLTELDNERLLETEFNTAGPVRIDDVDLTLFSTGDYQDLNVDIDTIGVGTRIWVAKDDLNSWNVYRASRADSRITAVTNLADGLILFTTNVPHERTQGEYIVVKNVNDIFNGVYKIVLVPNINGIVVEYTARDLTGFEVLRGLDAYMLVLQSQKVEYSSEIWDLQPATAWQPGDKVWVTRDDRDGRWTVYEKTEPWVLSYTLGPNPGTVSPGTGGSFTKNAQGSILVAGSPGDVDGTVGVYNIDQEVTGQFILGQTIPAPVGANEFGYSIALGTGTLFAAGAPKAATGGAVYIFQLGSNSDYSLVQTIQGDDVPGEEFGYVVKLSEDDLWLYVSSPGTNKVWAYKWNLNTLVYELVDTLEPTDGAPGDRFGNSLETTLDGSQIAVGAPEHNAGLPRSGAIYMYDRMVEAFETGDSKSYTTVRNFNSTYPTVLLDSTPLSLSDFTVTGPNSIELATFPRIKRVLRISIDTFTLSQKLLPAVLGDTDNFGQSVDICPNDCSVYIGAPRADSLVTSARNTGAVYRFLNQGRVYGTILGTTVNPVVNFGDSLRIDDFEIPFTGTSLASVIDDINNAALVGITATNVSGRLRIDSASDLAFIRLRILPGVGSAIADLGLEVYTQTQRIENPIDEADGQFGSSVSVSGNADRICVGAPDKSLVIRTTIDGGSTYFDDRSTTVRSRIPRAGAAYVFQLLRNDSRDINRPDVLGLAQTLYSTTVSPGDRFGGSSLFYANTLYVGSPGAWQNPVVWTANTFYVPGDVVEFNSLTYLVVNSYASGEIFDDVGFEGGNVISADQGLISVFNDATGFAGWAPLREQDKLIDISSINQAFAYNKIDSSKLLTFDYIDPAKGRILGQVSQEIDFKTSNDPAYYSNGTSVNVVPELAWSGAQVGKVWWDLSKVRWIEYEQGDFAYRSANWGKVFPGSETKIYEWIKSTVAPLDYVAAGLDGVPKDAGQTAYTAVNDYDKVSGIFITNYYFWVEKTTKVTVTGRRLSLENMVQLIDNPELSGVPYLTFLSADTVGVWNAVDSLVNGDVALHIDYDTQLNNNLIHTEYQLIQEGNADSEIPPTIINKIVDSLCGADVEGNAVPATNLTEAEKYGISIRPRQSVFKDQNSALRLVVDLLNQEFTKNPILNQGYNLTGLTEADETPTPAVGNYTVTVPDFTSLGYLNLDGLTEGYRVFVSYDINYRGWSIYTLVSGAWTIVSPLTDTQQINTQLYWQIQDWYATGFESVTKFTYNVDSEYDIARLNLEAGNTIRIRNAGDGNFKIYQVAPNLSLTTVGLQNATINILDTLWQQQPAVEARNILNAAISIFAGSVTYIDIFFALIRFALSEQKYVDWVFKTSFITVLQRIRRLDQYATYQRDNQDFVRDFIDEVKPYRTKIREYLLGYETLDAWDSDVTDFDLPGYYDVDYLRFRSPSGELPQDAELWQQPDNINWFSNYTYSITDILVEAAGTGYTVAPRILITGGGGTGAAAYALVSNGFLRGVVVTSAGTGYTSTPTVTLIGGNGTGARVSVRLGNTLTRKISTTIALDRVSYEATDYSSAMEWPAEPGNVSYTAGQLISYNDAYYYAATDFAPTPVFNTLNLIPAVDNAADRVVKFYEPRPGMPANDLAQVFTGIDYPGVFVTGRQYTDNSADDTIIRSYYTDIALGTRPEDILVDGGGYVDTYNSHSPQELVPGIVFDALEMRVFTIAPAAEAGIGAGPSIRVNSFQGDGTTVEYEVTTSNNHADSLFVYSKQTGQLVENTDFVFNRTTGVVTFTVAPAAADSIFVYLFSDAGYGKILDAVLPSDGTTAEFNLPTLDYNLVTDLYVTIDGVRTTAYEFRLGAATGSTLEFLSAPADGTHVHVYAYNGITGRKSFSEVYTQRTTVTTNVYPADYSIALEQPILYEGPLGSNVIVEVNGVRLRPANNAYYVGDGAETVYIVPVTVGVNPNLVSNNDVEVYVAGTRLAAGIGYVLAPSNGVDPRSVTLTTAPADGVEIVVSLFVGAEYRISSPDLIDISETVALQPGDVVKIISFSNHDALKIRTQVFVGATAELLEAQPGWDGVGFDELGFDSSIEFNVENRIYNFATSTVVQNNAPANSNYVWVTLNGVRLFPNYDFVLLDHGVLQLGTHLNVTNIDEIIVTSFTENTQVEPIGFRIFQNARGDVSYLRISAVATTSLVAPLLITDTEIALASVANMPVPSPELANPGIVFIDGERITYYEIDYDNNLLKRIRRGTEGTGAPAVHAVGTLVSDGSQNQKVPDDLGRIWLDAGDGAAASGIGLSFSSTTQALFLKAEPSYLPG